MTNPNKGARARRGLGAAARGVIAAGTIAGGLGVGYEMKVVDDAQGDYNCAMSLPAGSLEAADGQPPSPPRNEGAWFPQYEDPGCPQLTMARFIAAFSDAGMYGGHGDIGEGVQTDLFAMKRPDRQAVITTTQSTLVALENDRLGPGWKGKYPMFAYAGIAVVIANRARPRVGRMVRSRFRREGGPAPYPHPTPFTMDEPVLGAGAAGAPHGGENQHVYGWAADHTGADGGGWNQSPPGNPGN